MTAPDHDPWLKAALRHAPDADAAPPAAVSAAILRAARAAAPRRPPSLAERTGAFWSWLARPPIAAAFASLMLATTIVVMWRDAPVDPRVAPDEASAPAAPRAPAPAAATEASKSADAPATAVATPPGATPDAMPPAPSARVPESRAQPATAPLARSPGPAATRAEVPLAKAQAPRVEPPATLPPPQTESAAADATAAAGPTAPPAATAPAAERAEALTGRAAAGVGAPAAMAPPSARRADASGATGLRAADAAATPGSLFDTVRTEPQRWTWRRGTEAPRPADTALLDWLRQFEAATPRWDRPGAVPPRPATLTLARDGATQATLTLDADRALLVIVGGGVWAAAIPPEAARSLAAALEQIAR